MVSCVDGCSDCFRGHHQYNTNIQGNRAYFNPGGADRGTHKQTFDQMGVYVDILLKLNFTMIEFYRAYFCIFWFCQQIL